MKQAYPIIITSDSDFYVVYIPDFDINTQGKTISEAIEMARDAIEICIRYKLDQNQEIPIATGIDAIEHNEKEILILVDVEF